MTNIAIPDWLPTGVLPPHNAVSPTSAERSPYSVSLTDLVLRFNTSRQRHTILTGFLAFRNALQELGLSSGFQWLNGSFLEAVETTESRAPKDLDVVTFFHLPEGKTQESLAKQNPALFSPKENTSAFNVDTYFVCLDTPQPEPLVVQATYWYSMWSHRRNGDWKGFLQIDLAADEDVDAKANLESVTYGENP